MSVIRRALSVGLVLSLAACAAQAPSMAVPEATIVAEAPAAEEAPLDPARLAVASGQPVFIEFYTDW